MARAPSAPHVAHGSKSPELRISLRSGLPSPTEAWDAGATLARALLDRPGVDRAEITVNANRRQVVSWRAHGGGIVVSVHWALLEHVDDLVSLVTAGDRTAWARLRRAIPRDATLLVDAADVTGRVHDLEGILGNERARIRRAVPEVQVTWSRWGAVPPRRSLRLGSCEAGQPPLIRIHPVLDHGSVPEWFVGFVLFHELLHVVFPPIDRGLRREVHPASFRAAERTHPHYEQALAWEKQHIDALLLRARRRDRG